MNLNVMILSKEEATARGYESLTTGFKLPREQASWDKVLRDMNAGDVDCCAVLTADGWEVWRKGLTFRSEKDCYKMVRRGVR